MNEHLATLRGDLDGVFDPARFSIQRQPVGIGHLAEGSLAGEHPCCLDMLVHLPGGSLVLPEPYRSHKGIQSFIAICCEFEDGLVPDWRETHYAYLTIDRRIVRAGRSHRSGGWHFDGMQGARYPEKIQACHQYVVSDRLPTEFTDAATDASGLSELHHHWFEELGRQVGGDARVFTPEPMEVAVMSAYQLHRSKVASAEEEGWRTFLRLDFSLKQQDRLGNTVNPNLVAPFVYVPRDLPAGLRRGISDSGWEGAVRFES